MFPLKHVFSLSRRLAVISRTGTSNSAVHRHRRYSDDKSGKFVNPENYKVFRDDDSSVILDVEEERNLLESQLGNEPLDFEEIDQFEGLNTSRE